MPAWRYAGGAGARGADSSRTHSAWGHHVRAALAGRRYPPALIAIVALLLVLSTAFGLEVGRRLSPPPDAPAGRLAIDNPYAGGGDWYKGNLQVASVRGIGKDLPSAIGRWYGDHGYAFLGISDQNTYTWPSEFASSSLTGVPVVDASYAFGDVLAVGDDRWLPAGNFQQAVDWIAADSALPVLSAGASSAVDPRTVQRLGGLFGLEVYDARLAAAGQGDAIALWDALLTAGNRVYGFAADDVSSLADPALGHAWIEVQAGAPDLDSLMSSLRRGDFYASTGAEFTNIVVEGRTITATASAGATLRFIGKDGRLLEAVAGSSGSYNVTGSEGYVRIEAADNHGRAWSQPLFLVRP